MTKAISYLFSAIPNSSKWGFCFVFSKKIFSLSILLITLNDFAFSQLFFSGKILDRRTLKPIEYANVFVEKQLNLLTDSLGYFEAKVVNKNNDSLYISALGYQPIGVALNSLKQSNIFYLNSVEEIESIEAKATKLRTFRKKIGYFQKANVFSFNNISHFLKSRTLSLSYIPNEYAKEGFIEKIFVPLYSSKTTSYDPISRQKIRIQDPEWIKVRVRCVYSSKDLKPLQDISTVNMIFKINTYKSQWLDISSYNVPFPKNGAFVGVEVIEVKEKANFGWGTVSFPVFKKNKNQVSGYVNIGKNRFKPQEKLPQFGAEVSLIKD